MNPLRSSLTAEYHRFWCDRIASLVFAARTLGTRRKAGKPADAAEFELLRCAAELDRVEFDYRCFDLDTPGLEPQVERLHVAAIRYVSVCHGDVCNSLPKRSLQVRKRELLEHAVAPFDWQQSPR